MSEKKVIKLLVNISPEAADALRWIAKRRGTTMTRVIASAIASEKFIEEAKLKGEKIIIEERTGELRELIFR